MTIGPILNEWTQTTSNIWKKRYKKVLTKGVGLLKTHRHNPPLPALLDEINYKTLSGIVTYLDSSDDEESYSDDSNSDTQNENTTETGSSSITSHEQDELDFKTHSQPVPVLVGVEQGKASELLRSLWRESAPPVPEWRVNMQRLIDATPPVSTRESTVTSPSNVFSPLNSHHDNYLNTIISESDEDDRYDTRQSSASFVTANEEDSIYRTNSRTGLLDNEENHNTGTLNSLVPTASENSTTSNSNQFYDVESEDDELYNHHPSSFGQSTITPRWPDSSSIAADPIEEVDEDDQPSLDYPAPSEFSDFDNSSFQSVLSSSKSAEEAVTAFRPKKKVKISTDISEFQKLPKRFFEDGFRRYLIKLRNGEMVRAEKVLVMIKGCKSNYISPDFNENENVETQKLANWSEYVMVARKSGDMTAPVVLQFYRNFNVERVKADVETPISKLDIKLIPGKVHVKFYSTLDKTIVLWRSTMKGSLIYVFRSRSHESAMRWLALFRQALGVNQSQNLLLGIPDLGLTVEIGLPLRQILKEKKLQIQQEEHTNRDRLIPFSELKSSLTRHSHIASYIFSAVVESLSSIDYLKSRVQQMFINRHQEEEKIGLAWRRYDRLEWVNEEFNDGIYCNWVLHKTHDLEIRPMKAYPTSVTFDTGITMQEPMPVEGYLVRLTTWTNRGNKRKFGRVKALDRLFYKMLYFHTHENLLFFSLPKNAVPPVVEPGKNKDKYFMETAPFRIDELTGNIEWMSAPLNEIEKRDRAAAFEFQRRVSLVSESDGFIDLCEVVEVRPVLRADDDEPLGTFNPDNFEEQFVSGGYETGETTTYADYNTFEIVLNQSGESNQNSISSSSRPCIIRLQAFNRITRDRWITHLTALAEYWKRRAYEDVAEINETRERNLTTLHIPDEEMEQIIGENSPKWETASGEANPIVHRPLFVTGGRAVKFRGILYGHFTSFPGAIGGFNFRRYYVVLDHGARLTILQRPETGLQSAIDHPSYYYRKIRVIELLEHPVYLYCGPLTADDINGSGLWSGTPGVSALPRVYPDGWRSAEEDPYRCFVLRFGSTKVTPNVTGTTTFFGNSGLSMVFFARSRQERDLWVLALNSEIEKTIEFNKGINIT